jgi:hypothetical protein
MTTFEQQVQQRLNEESAEEMKKALGYAPNPRCPKCGGSGRVHPLGLNGKPDYSQTEMCNEVGCLRDSYERRMRR